MITATALTKLYDSKLALDHLTLAVHPGEIYCLLGPIGSGKSTTINLFFGFTKPTRGSSAICGFDSVTQSLEVKKHAAPVSHYAGSEVSAQVIKLLQQLPWDENIRSLMAFLRILCAISPEGAAFEHERKVLEKIILMVEDRREFSLMIPSTLNVLDGWHEVRIARNQNGFVVDIVESIVE
jgi:ABC-type multidrug transport system ATPase subunit